MDIRPIRTDADHAAALREIDRLWNAAPGSREADELDVLATLVERYEEERFAFPSAEPVAVINTVMADRGYTRGDFAKVLGSQSRATEVLSGKRSLSVDHIRRVSRSWKIPADLLLGSTVGPKVVLGSRGEHAVHREKIAGRVMPAAKAAAVKKTGKFTKRVPVGPQRAGPGEPSKKA